MDYGILRFHSIYLEFCDFQTSSKYLCSCVLLEEKGNVHRFLVAEITTCTQEIYDAFYDDDIGKGLFHAHTYSANPIACATAIAGIDLLQSEEIQQNIKTIQSWHQEFSNEIKDHSKVKTTRQQGVIFALELDIAMERYGDLRYRIYEFCMAEGVYLRPLGATIYILAPYITTRDQMERVYAAIRKVLDAF